MLIAVARTGLLREVAGFTTEDAALRRGARVVLSTERGTDLGEVLLPPGERPRAGVAVRGAVLRRAGADDLARADELETRTAPHELRLARRLFRELALPGKVVAAEHLLGGERVVFYFKSEARLDLRAVTKALAAELGPAAVELRQVGAREEARLVGDYGPCGRPLCARVFLGDRAAPVTLRMVVSQHEALDPRKLLGASGLLKDCLAFEDAVYREARRALPELGLRCRTARHGRGEIVGHETLAGRVRVLLESGGTVVLAASEVEIIPG
jgi:cell fate regulator YaaT (PSP1 superfamily)